MLPAQIVYLAASKAVLGMVTDSSLWTAATLRPGTAILAGIQARVTQTDAVSCQEVAPAMYWAV